MTELYNLLLGKYQVRKSSKQKADFAEFACDYAKRNGYAARAEAGSGGCCNIVIGDPDRADVIYTAHYDTQPIMPFPNLLTPKNIFLYILYQLLIVVLLMIVPIGVEIWLLSMPQTEPFARLAFVVLYFVEFGLLMLGPANKHTANDNTSGVATVLRLVAEMPEEARTRVAFVLFDLEEVGLVGSRSFAKMHKAALKKKPIVNFDCVSDGKDIMFVLKKGARGMADVLRRAFPSEGEFRVHIETRGVVYPSDQSSFPAGIGVAAFNRTRRGMLYVDKIHTAKDTVFMEDNIDFLVAGSIRLVTDADTPV